mgnify:CR=1 FL=1
MLLVVVVEIVVVVVQMRWWSAVVVGVPVFSQNGRRDFFHGWRVEFWQGRRRLPHSHSLLQSMALIVVMGMGRVVVVVVAPFSMFFSFFLFPVFFNAPPLPFQTGSQAIDVFRLLKASFVLLFTVLFTFLAALPMMSLLFVVMDQGRW